jgi:hypothetical protein
VIATIHYSSLNLPPHPKLPSGLQVSAFSHLLDINLSNSSNPKPTPFLCSLFQSCPLPNIIPPHGPFIGHTVIISASFLPLRWVHIPLSPPPSLSQQGHSQHLCSGFLSIHLAPFKSIFYPAAGVLFLNSKLGHVVTLFKIFHWFPHQLAEVPQPVASVGWDQPGLSTRTSPGSLFPI